MLKTITIAAITATLLAATAPAHAWIGMNGGGNNGIHLNGGYGNGVHPNGGYGNGVASDSRGVTLISLELPVK